MGIFLVVYIMQRYFRACSDEEQFNWKITMTQDFKEREMSNFHETYCVSNPNY